MDEIFSDTHERKMSFLDTNRPITTDLPPTPSLPMPTLQETIDAKLSPSHSVTSRHSYKSQKSKASHLSRKSKRSVKSKLTQKSPIAREENDPYASPKQSSPFSPQQFQSPVTSPLTPTKIGFSPKPVTEPKPIDYESKLQTLDKKEMCNAISSVAPRLNETIRAMAGAQNLLGQHQQYFEDTKSLAQDFAKRPEFDHKDEELLKGCITDMNENNLSLKAFFEERQREQAFLVCFAVDLCRRMQRLGQPDAKRMSMRSSMFLDGMAKRQVTLTKQLNERVVALHKDATGLHEALLKLLGQDAISVQQAGMIGPQSTTDREIPPEDTDDESDDSLDSDGELDDDI